MSAPKPFKRPRRVDPVRRIAQGLRGRCYPYAVDEAVAYLYAGAPRPALRVVHGLVSQGIAHAWLERGGYAYDWQLLAIPGREAIPIPLAEYYEKNRAQRLVAYTAKQATDQAIKAGHYGPWVQP